MKFIFKPAPNYKDNRSTNSIMFELTIGLLIVLVYSLYNAYTISLNNMIHIILLSITCIVTSLVVEVLYALVIKKKPLVFLKGSYPWVTSLIIILICPSNTTIYAIFIATIVGIIFGKLVFGGFGNNIFNPAGVGRAVITLSFAATISPDVISSATPMQSLASMNWIVKPDVFNEFVSQFGGLSNLFIGNYYGGVGETSFLVIGLVGIVLAIRRVIDYRIPLVYMSVIFIGSSIVAFTNGMGLYYSLYHIFSGGAIFGAVFMLTDPVTNPTSISGRCLFAMGAGFITLVIRLAGNYPEGVLFSILLMNMMTPVIDRLIEGVQLEKIKKLVLANVVMAVIGFGIIFGISLTLDNTDSASVGDDVLVIERVLL